MIQTHHNGAEPQIKTEEIKGSHRQEVNLIKDSSRKLKFEAKLHIPFSLKFIGEAERNLKKSLQLPQAGTRNQSDQSAIRLFHNKSTVPMWFCAFLQVGPAGPSSSTKSAYQILPLTPLQTLTWRSGLLPWLHPSIAYYGHTIKPLSWQTQEVPSRCTRSAQQVHRKCPESSQEVPHGYHGESHTHGLSELPW